MKLGNSLTLLTVAVAAVGLETTVLCLYWAGRELETPPFNTARFLLEGHAVAALGCGLAYLASSRLLRPVEALIDGIALFGQGRFEHRIRRTRIGELDLVVERLNGMAQKLGEVDALKSEFLANVSHELRSPLAAMEQYAELMLAGPELSGKSRDNLRRIQANLERLRRMVENLLEMSRIEAGGVAAKAEPFELAQAVSDVCELLAPKLALRRLSLKTRLEPGAGCVLADRDLVKQILTNLVDNAVKYNREGGTVTVASAVEEGRARLTVTDTGPGIAPEDLGKLFERFRRLPGPTGEPKPKGTGLGLAISRSLARAMGGDLTVESRPGQGSTFTCRLPLARTS